MGALSNFATWLAGLPMTNRAFEHGSPWTSNPQCGILVMFYLSPFLHRSPNPVYSMKTPGFFLAYILVLFPLVLPSQASSPSSPAPDAEACAALAGMPWGGFRIDEAEHREATGEQPAHCFVKGAIDAEIGFELLMPLPENWNGRFVMGGGGGYVGSIQNAALQYAPTLLADGFATAGTDTGHQGSTLDASWALNREDREINFGFRAVHVTAVTAKTVMRIYYDRDIDYSYFVGCSRGGGQAMLESQRYPDDFDGIVAGAPAIDWTGITVQLLQVARAMYPDPGDLSEPVVSEATRTLLEDAILERCDALDGLKDGMMTDPRECDFDPTTLPRCEQQAPGQGCVTDAELEAIRTVYEGPTVDGKQVHPGFPFGGEAHPEMWGSWITGAENAFGAGQPSLHFAFADQFFKYLVFDDPDWDYASYDFSSWHDDVQYIARILNATETDLSPFEIAGGKILYWTGWSDAALTALDLIDYYEAVQRDNDQASSFARLFMMPGVGHCAGGPGPDRVDWLSAIQGWVEEGHAPDRLIATKYSEEGEIEMQRPLCAYPARAVYNGSGDGRTESDFTCQAP